MRPPASGPAEIGRWARLLRSRRRRLVAVAVVVAIGAGVVVAHSGVAMNHPGDGADICLAVLDAGLLATGAALLNGRANSAPKRHPVFLSRSFAPSVAVVPAVEPRSRAGPAELQVFRS
jgi:hypothetical protein